MSDDEAGVARAVAAVAARAEQLRTAAQLSDQEFRGACRVLFRASSLDEVSRIDGDLPDHPLGPLPPLDVNPVRNELLKYGSWLERFIPESYAGYRLVNENRFAEIGFVSDLPRHLRAARNHVSFPTRLSAFAPTFALVELRYALVMITRALEQLGREGFQVRSLQLSMDRNAVIVGVAEELVEPAQVLRERFGPAVVVEHGYQGVFGSSN
jgi:hypothetical protein